MEGSQMREPIATGKRCLRCGKEWWPRSPERPRVCPKCKSPYYDVPKKTKEAVE